MDEHTDWTAEYHKIQQLLARYNMAGDRGKVDELASVFTEDGVLYFNAESSQGRKAIVRRLSRTARDPRLLVTRHHLTTSLIEVRGETATGRTYFQVLTNSGLDHHGVYVDRFVNISGTWLIERREVRIDWQAENTLFPPLNVRGRAQT